MLTVFDCPLIKLSEGSEQIISAEKGNMPFDVSRVFYSYDIPQGEARGAHAHKACHQLLVAVKGTFEVVLDDGTDTRVVLLDSPDCGLHVKPGIWAAEQNFTEGTICLVLASHGYDENDYIRDYDDYLRYIKGL